MGEYLVFLVATCTGNNKGPITGGRDLMVCALCTGEGMRTNLSLVRTFSCLGARELNPFYTLLEAWQLMTKSQAVSQVLSHKNDSEGRLLRELSQKGN